MTTTHASPAHEASVHDDAAHHTHRPLYLKIFAALMVLLVLTVVAAKFQIPGSGNVIVALTIAVIKAALIVMFFMHFRDSDHVTWLVGASTIAWFMILIILTFQDYMSRDWITSMPGK
jgi:cytochrome c oxidase subunit 4